MTTKKNYDVIEEDDISKNYSIGTFFKRTAIAIATLLGIETGAQAIGISRGAEASETTNSDQAYINSFYGKDEKHETNAGPVDETLSLLYQKINRGITEQDYNALHNFLTASDNQKFVVSDGEGNHDYVVIQENGEYKSLKIRDQSVTDAIDDILKAEGELQSQINTNRQLEAQREKRLAQRGSEDFVEDSGAVYQMLVDITEGKNLTKYQNPLEIEEIRNDVDQRSVKKFNNNFDGTEELTKLVDAIVQKEGIASSQAWNDYNDMPVQDLRKGWNTSEKLHPGQRIRSFEIIDTKEYVSEKTGKEHGGVVIIEYEDQNKGYAVIPVSERAMEAIRGKDDLEYVIGVIGGYSFDSNGGSTRTIGGTAEVGKNDVFNIDVSAANRSGDEISKAEYDDHTTETTKDVDESVVVGNIRLPNDKIVSFKLAHEGNETRTDDKFYDNGDQFQVESTDEKNLDIDAQYVDGQGEIVKKARVSINRGDDKALNDGKTNHTSGFTTSSEGTLPVVGIHYEGIFKLENNDNNFPGGSGEKQTNLFGEGKAKKHYDIAGKEGMIKVGVSGARETLDTNNENKGQYLLSVDQKVLDNVILDAGIEKVIDRSKASQLFLYDGGASFLIDDLRLSAGYVGGQETDGASHNQNGVRTNILANMINMGSLEQLNLFGNYQLDNVEKEEVDFNNYKGVALTDIKIDMGKTNLHLKGNFEKSSQNVFDEAWQRVGAINKFLGYGGMAGLSFDAGDVSEKVRFDAGTRIEETENTDRSYFEHPRMGTISEESKSESDMRIDSYRLSFRIDDKNLLRALYDLSHGGDGHESLSIAYEGLANILGKTRGVSASLTHSMDNYTKAVSGQLQIRNSLGMRNTFIEGGATYDADNGNDGSAYILGQGRKQGDFFVGGGVTLPNYNMLKEIKMNLDIQKVNGELGGKVDIVVPLRF